MVEKNTDEKKTENIKIMFTNRDHKSMFENSKT